MSLKNLFKNSDAVSPVIGVILMVAITVILAAAIGSSVFGQGPEKSAPQANIEITPVSTYVSPSSPASVKLEHLGGDPIDFGNVEVTKVMVSVDGGNSTDVSATSLGTMNAGSVTNFDLGTTNVTSGSSVNIKIIDVKTSQLISDKDIRF
jgi:flagellin-like protein